MRSVRYVVNCRRVAFLCNRLLAAGLLLSDIEQGEEKLCFSVPFSQFSVADVVLAEYGFQYQKKGYFGFKALLRLALSRPFLILSVALSVALVFLSQSFIYGYSIRGNRYVNTSQVQEVLREKGAIGVVYKKSIDAAELKKAVAAIEGVSFASVKTEGSRLIVEVKEELPREEPDEVLYSPVLSTHSAVVTRIVAESGTPTVRSGDKVSAGDTLISPSYVFTEGEAPAPARGEAGGVVTYQKEVLLPLYTVEKVTTGETFRTRTVSLFGKNVGTEILPDFAEYDLAERVVYRGVGVKVVEKTYRRRAAVTRYHDFDAEAPTLVRDAIAELLLAVPFNARERGRVEVTQKKLDNVLYIVLYCSVEQRIDSLFAA